MYGGTRTGAESKPLVKVEIVCLAHLLGKALAAIVDGNWEANARLTVPDEEAAKGPTSVGASSTATRLLRRHFSDTSTAEWYDMATDEAGRGFVEDCSDGMTEFCGVGDDDEVVGTATEGDSPEYIDPHWDGWNVDMSEATLAPNALDEAGIALTGRLMAFVFPHLKADHRLNVSNSTTWQQAVAARASQAVVGALGSVQDTNQVKLPEDTGQPRLTVGEPPGVGAGKCTELGGPTQGRAHPVAPGCHADVDRVKEPPRRVTKKMAENKAEQKATAMGMHDGTASAQREECVHSLLAAETAPQLHDTWRGTLSPKTMGKHDGTAPAQREKCVQFLLAAENCHKVA